MSHGRVLIGVAVVVMAVTGCSRLDRSADGTAEQQQPAIGTRLSMDQLVEQVGHSLALIETPLATGSGIVLPGPVLVTTAHVVWPYRAVDVRFPDGTTSPGREVIAVDWVADLAVIDLTTLDEPLIPLTGAPPPPIGDPVYLVGFPAAAETGPTIESGTLLGSRSWVEAGLDYLESDAVAAGGHSGGALVDGVGHLIGITGIELGDRGALALAADNLADRVEAMVDGLDIEGLGDRWTADLIAGPEPAATTRNLLDEVSWVFEATAGTDVALNTNTQGLLEGSIVGPDGFLEATLDGSTMAFVPALSGPHFATLVPGSAAGSVIELSGEPTLERLTDPDRGRELRRGDLVFGNIDHPGDLDWYTIELTEGESIIVTASSPNADMAVFIGPVDALGRARCREQLGWSRWGPGLGRPFVVHRPPGRDARRGRLRRDPVRPRRIRCHSRPLSPGRAQSASSAITSYAAGSMAATAMVETRDPVQRSSRSAIRLFGPMSATSSMSSSGTAAAAASFSPPR